MTQPLAIQSWCYRHWKLLPEVIQQLKNTGVSATELCAAHVNFSDVSTHVPAIELCHKENMRIVAIGVERLNGNTEQDRLRFEFCKVAGINHMSFTFAPETMFDGLRNVEKLADQYDVNVGIHNHGGYDWLGNPTILRYIFNKTSKRIGLYLDTAWAIDAKQNPVQMVEQFADRMYGIHIKDFTYDRARQPTDVVIGTANLDLPKLVQTLKQIKFGGPLVVEYEGDVDNPVPPLKQCVQAIQKLL